ncbi:MAG: hypothetical protein QGG71_24520 [Pirellulaceae bacterium]|nr:hypothetical protein [Pirellulaceae bacterium]
MVFTPVLKCLLRISIVLLAVNSCVAADDTARLATFSADVTIPLNHRCMGVLPTKSKKIVDPLYAHGFVLLGRGKPIVICAVDWCEIRNGAYDQWRDALAKAAGTTRERVLVSSLHQHDAPVTDRGAARLLREVGLDDELYHETFHDETVTRLAQALRDSLATAVTVTHLGLGQAPVRQVASNRRVVRDDGSVRFDRGSRSGGSARHAEADEGLIDPLLKTISFYNGDKPVLALHSYATHPMSYYGRGEVSSDFVGLARARRQRDDQSIRQIYVSGCSGDVTAGKYNNGSPESRLVLVDRMYQAMVDAWKNTRRVPLDQIAFRNTTLELEFHPSPNLTAEALKRALHDDKLTVEKRVLSAMGLSSRQRVAAGQKIDFPCVDFGTAQIVLFPAEAFVGYQLMAQKMRPESFVMSIGYGECWPGYIPTNAAFDDHFGDSWLWVAPGSEARVRTALEQVLVP